jgi:hypothetical protein
MTIEEIYANYIRRKERVDVGLLSENQKARFIFI